MEFQHPCNVLVCGPTKSGKTELVKRIVQNISSMFNPVPKEIWWCYNQWQASYNELANKVKFIEGFPSRNLAEESAVRAPLLIVLDDLMQDVNEKTMSKLFTQGTHHGDISCIHNVQNVFYQGMQTSRVNAQYIILMKNPSDKLQSTNLGRQLFPRKLAYFQESYEDACNEPHGYLAIDLSQNTPEHLRLRTKIFPNEEHIIYSPKA